MEPLIVIIVAPNCQMLPGLEWLCASRPKPRYSLGSYIYRRIGGRDLSNGWNPLDTANRKKKRSYYYLAACAISFIFLVYKVVCSYST